MIILNKVFSGSYLTNNIGHESINFFEAYDNESSDIKKRYIYINPYGEIDKEKVNDVEYVFHIIDIAPKNKKCYYELSGVSVVSEDQTNAVYYRGSNAVKVKKDSPIIKYNGKSFSFYDVFNSKKAQYYSLRADKLLKPTKRIFIYIKCEESKIVETDSSIQVHLKANPQHHITYIDGEEREMLVEQLIEKGYLIEDETSVNFDDYDDELSYSVISGRVNLEVSTSNLLSYFFTRDKSLLNMFINKVLKLSEISEDEEFEIKREEKNIDLLFVSNKRVIVIENKIDSDINGVVEDKGWSQLSKYYKNVESDYKHIKNRKYFLLVPEYNDFSIEKLKKYKNGDKYEIRTYKDLFDEIRDYKYKPNGKEPSEHGYHMFKEFVKSIEYLSWSKAMQRRNTTYVRLKQRLKELEEYEESKN